jgi:anti-sigma B factor antagonist
MADSTFGGFDLSETALGDGRVVLRVAGDLDLTSAPNLERSIDRLSTQGRVCVFDLSQVTFIDSSGLQALLKSARADGAGGGITVRGALPEIVVRLFELTGLRDSLRREESS